MAPPRYLSAGECALVVEYGETFDPALHARILALDAALAGARIDGLRECVPTYRSLMVHHDPRRLSRQTLITTIESLLHAEVPVVRAARTWRLAACYDGTCGEDLDEVAGLLGRSREDLAQAHAEAAYTVVMYGFAPGFVFLDGLPKELVVSRRRTPRPPAPPGALTIANGQALIASIAMPTGWYMLGRTPAKTFDIARDPPFPIAVGDRVRFERVDPERFAALEREAALGHDLLAVEG